jgi:hypothetical protein
VSQLISRSEPDVLCSSVGVAPRLRLLVAVHLLVGMAPAATFLLPRNVWFPILERVLDSISGAQVMLLAFWLGMGTSKSIRRLLSTLCGSAYVTVWPVVALLSSPDYMGPSAIGCYLGRFSINCAVVLVFAGILLLIRRRGGELRRVSESGTSDPPSRFQYSILHLLVITSIVAVVLGLARSTRATDTADIGWYVATLGILLVVVFAVNSVCAVWAALGAGQVRLRVSLVLLVAILLGTALPIAARQHLVSWRAFASLLLATVLPTAILIVSLLVVRSCGYRLTRSRSAG